MGVRTRWVMGRCEGFCFSPPTVLEIDTAGIEESAGSCVDQPIKLSLKSCRFATVHTLPVILSLARLDNQIRQSPLWMHTMLLRGSFWGHWSWRVLSSMINKFFGVCTKPWLWKVKAAHGKQEHTRPQIHCHYIYFEPMIFKKEVPAIHLTIVQKLS